MHLINKIAKKGRKTNNDDKLTSQVDKHRYNVLLVLVWSETGGQARPDFLRQKDRQTGGQTDRQADRQGDRLRQADRLTNKQVGRHDDGRDRQTGG